MQCKKKKKKNEITWPLMLSGSLMGHSDKVSLCVYRY